ncbi:cation diffusion facilitator family transporter [Paraburkholderia rhizosphaerae]|uniref:Cation diffusion facilitator family transporter n=1 Tax=Paraburkholderia rhizosphaerae TaxID=480658 RepID=A0A4R8LJF3_9BURK|nr:cation diffusion facilitator family transporter [Paraburkholderia rhizosphaerae]TDY43912.1 cation diffusion facilitator family transporter [Paraburkholderia rhizosphaerae]
MSTTVPRAVYYALASNVAVALCKFAAAAYTASGAALAEAIHSSADCMNQFFMLVGRRAASERADEQHPLGFGRESYFYAMVVALQIFIVGGLASAAVGIYRLTHITPLDHPLVVVAVLGASIVIEGAALRASVRTVGHELRSRGLWRWFRETGKPELLLVIGEDIAALAGVLVSLIAVAIAVWTGNPVFDALGGIGVGLVLMGTALLSLREIKSLIVGESAHRSVRAAMEKWLAARPEVRRIVSLVVLRWADDLLVAVQAELEPRGGEEQLVRAIDEIELALRAAFPAAKWIFFEPELSEHGDHPV